MILNSKQLVGVPVVTKSGTPVGKLASLDLDADTGRLVAIHVKTRGLLPGLLSDELMVGWDAVIEMKADEVVIADTAVQVGSRALAKERGAVPSSVMAQRRLT